MSGNMRFLNLVITVLVCGFMTGCTSTPSSQPTITENASQAYELGVGDTIRLIVFGHEQLSGEFSVGPSGNISFPLVLEIPVHGLTIKALEKSLTQKTVTKIHS